MPIIELPDWLDEYLRPVNCWCAKRLAGNDTLANGSNQAGPYLPKEFVFHVLPETNSTEEKNPSVWFDIHIDSHLNSREARAVYYNNKFHENPKKGRNETRITNLGGASSPLLDPDSTGALALFVFTATENNTSPECHVWVCEREIEESIIEDRIGSIEPGRTLQWPPQNDPQLSLLKNQLPSRTTCRMTAKEIPPTWLSKFPTGMEIVEKSISMRPDSNLNVDHRLLRRRECEFEIFQSIEEAIELPTIQNGFDTIDEFVACAQTILQRRKSRAGLSLELHIKKLLCEERLIIGRDFDYQPKLKGRPDFIFPSTEAYENETFPVDKLRILAVKTTFRDRWRQVTEEASRIPIKHLLTLQEGVSIKQFEELYNAGLRLVVPMKLHSKYPKQIRQHLISFESFLGDIRVILASLNS